MSEFSVHAGQIRRWKAPAFQEINEKMFLVVSTYVKSGVEWADILLDGKCMTLAKRTVRLDTVVIENELSDTHSV
jgi:hypothetical protein